MKAATVHANPGWWAGGRRRGTWSQESFPTDLDELAREGVRRMLVAALQAEVADYVERHRHHRDERGHALVVRNGRARARKVTLGGRDGGGPGPAGPRPPGGPPVDELDPAALDLPEPQGGRGAADPLPAGLSTRDFQPALTGLLGEEAAGLSPANINRLVGIWEAEWEAFRTRDLSQVDYVYVWADGVHVNVRLGEQDRLCLLVLIGARPDGTKELIVVEDGYRESKESWQAVLRERGMRAPVLAIGDAALGFWAAVRDTWPETREQRDWVHRLRNVLDKLPKRLQGKAKAALREIMYAPTRKAAEEGITRFRDDYGAKYPKAVESLTRDQEKLLTFFDFPAEHWKHIRTANPVESTFATVRLRQRITKGPGSRQRGLLMAYKLLRMAEERWRRLDGFQLLPLVRAGVSFLDGEQVEREDTDEQRRVAA